MSNPASPPPDEPLGASEPSPKELFVAAIARPPEQRAAFLEQACRNQPHIRGRVEALLRAYDGADSFLDEGSAASAAAAPDDSTHRAGHSMVEATLDPLVGARIGPYKLLERIGEGGFGAVYMAEQREPVHRKVALKLIKPGMDSRQVIARFEAERQALALMEHPHIARVFDGGVTDAAIGARPYFVMEYVKGDAITAFADAHRLSIRDRLDLFTQVCQAVQHAHTKGIIHRDLKPRNVLVSMVDGRPFAKVIDFGIAKATGSPLTDKTLFTEHRQLVGTPEYMSPEQAEGSPDIDTRTDVYALGVLLYELLTGATPFDARRLRSAAFAEMQRIIKEEEPPLPSVRSSRSLETLVATAAARQVEPGKLGTMIRGELDWIVMKALDKDRGQRYESANQLVADVQRHLTGEPVIAAPPSAAYRLRKFVKKHRGSVIAAGLVTTTLVLGVVGTTLGLLQAREEERRATAEAQRASRMGRFLQSTLFGAGSEGELSANGEVLRDLIAGAAASGETLDPQRWPNVRLALRLIEGHWRETAPSTAEFSRVLTGLLDSALTTGGVPATDSTAGTLAQENARGVLLVLTGRLDEAERLFRAALTHVQSPGASPGIARADQLTRLGLVLQARHGWQAGSDLFDESLAIRRKVVGHSSALVAEALEDRARACMGDADRAVPYGLLKECLAIRRGREGAAPIPDVARTLSLMAHFAAESREHDLARGHYIDALQAWKQAFPGDHERVAEAYASLGWHVSAHVDAREGEELIQQSVDMLARLGLGVDRKMSTALSQLGVAQMMQCHLTRAATTLYRALEIDIQTGGPIIGEPTDGFSRLRNCARRLAAIGDVAAAETSYRRLVSVTDRPEFGDDFWKRVVRTELREFLEWRGRADEGRALIADDQRLRGDSSHYMDYPQRLTEELEWIGERLLNLGRYADAEATFRSCLAQRERIPLRSNNGDDGKFLLPLTNGLIGFAVMKQGKFAQAEPLMIEACESVFPDHFRNGARREAIERLLSLYDAWQADEPDEARSAKAAQWRERLATLELATSFSEALGIENVRDLLNTVSASDSLSYPQWKRARTFVRLMTGEWTEDPITFGCFRELVAKAIKTIEMQPSAPDSNVVVEPDKSSIDYVVSHAALSALDGRWDDADAALGRTVGERSAISSDDAVRLIGCHAALKECLDQTGGAHSLYRRVLTTLEGKEDADPLALASAILGVSRTLTSGRDDFAHGFRRAYELLIAQLPPDDPRVIRCRLEWADTMSGWVDTREEAGQMFSEAIALLDTEPPRHPLALADALRRYGAWLYWQWRDYAEAYPPSRATDALERAVQIYRAAGLIASPRVADALQLLSQTQAADGAYRSAAESMQESLEIRLSLGETDVCVKDDGARLGGLLEASDYLAASGDLADAERFYRAAVSIAERDPDGAYGAREARAELSQFLMWTGREAETASLHQQPGRNDIPDPISYEDRLVRCCRNIAAHLLRTGDATELERAVAIIERGSSILDAADPESVFVDWWKADLDGLLGGVLAAQKSFEKAEPRVLASYRTLAACGNVPMEPRSRDREVRDALKRIIRLYDAWHVADATAGHDASAAEWRARLELTPPTSAPSSQP